ncbi:MAG: hypothetical protein RL199_1720, partial [Pseudomonadota bacterium]
MSQQPATASLEPVDDASALPPELDLASLTPMQRQYLEIKAQNPDALLFFRLGDFYELFYDDAKVAAEFLNITLTARAKGEVRIPMCGVPYHAAKGYVARLVEAGYRVAICEQVEVPGQAKGIVRREVTRVVTPGTVFDEDGREAKTATYLAALVPAATGGALALIEATTGDFRVFVTADDGPLVEELARVEPRELLVDETDLRLASLLGSLGPQVVRTRRGPKVFEPKRGFEKLCKHFGVATLDGFGLGQRPEAWAAAGAVLAYVEETQRSALVHVRQLSTYETRGTLLIDAASRRNLDLLKNAVDGRRQGSLVGTIDRTATSMGGRLLSQWMLYPLTDVEAIGRRQEAVGELFTSAVLREDLTTVLREVGDLERLVGRLVVGQGNARDVRALGLSLRRVPDLRMLLSTCTSRMLRACADELPDLASFGEGLVQAIVDEPPSILRDGGLFRHGFHEGLDELNGLRLEGKDAILRMEAEERRRTGIPSLKIKQNSVFGYYIEVTKANLAAVPLDYVRKQTTANAERYITPVLREFEDKVFGAEERALALELALFEELRGHVVQKAEGILATARLVATLDVLLSLARAASDLGWSRPEVNEGRLLRILEGRHPVVERAL